MIVTQNNYLVAIFDGGCFIKVTVQRYAPTNNLSFATYNSEFVDNSFRIHYVRRCFSNRSLISVLFLLVLRFLLIRLPTQLESIPHSCALDFVSYSQSIRDSIYRRLYGSVDNHCWCRFERRWRRRCCFCRDGGGTSSNSSSRRRN